MRSAFVFVLTLSLARAAAGAEPVSCPFSAAELTTAFGSPVKEGTKGFEYAFGSGKALSCRYEAKDFTLVVNQKVMSDPSQVKGWTSPLAGKTEALAGDPDGAIRQTDQGDNTNPNLQYVRGRVIVELRLMGVGKTNPGFEAHNRRLVALRRLP